MSRKHYRAIAASLASKWTQCDSLESIRTFVMVAHAIADAMQRDNPRFDRAKFLAACRESK